ncbi:hypothetical protein [Pusillimonas sp.]|uniref:hypothetical protein n=1 Tax=Pusillimonas sp. TaxID=3040095 RepID=UPI0037CAA7CC
MNTASTNQPKPLRPLLLAHIPIAMDTRNQNKIISITNPHQTKSQNHFPLKATHVTIATTTMPTTINTSAVMREPKKEGIWNYPYKNTSN